jgi:hypothetical protein
MVEIQKTVDGWFTKIQTDIGKKIGAFVAFFFFLLAIGIFIGIIAMQHYPEQAMLAVLFPAIAGIIAYYNRAFAIIIFIIMLIFIFIL